MVYRFASSILSQFRGHENREFSGPMDHVWAKDFWKRAYTENCTKTQAVQYAHNSQN